MEKKNLVHLNITAKSAGTANMIVLIAGICLLLAVALWRSAFDFTVDAAPVGSMMLAASVGFGIASIFLFGFAFGRLA